MKKDNPLIVGKPVLIVVDAQQGGYDPPKTEGRDWRMPGFVEYFANIPKLVESAREAGVPIIFFQEEHRRNMVDFGRELDGDEHVHCLEGDPGTPVAREVGMRDDDYFIRKRRYSCFFGTELEILLRGLKAETLILCGGFTDVCVHYTFVDAHQYDYHVRVVEDAVAGSSVPAHDASLRAMEYLQHGARRTTAAMQAAFAARRSA
ncbi:cysteine hydrolase family protein [Solimonas marina]|uniref:Cysteine hydrolase n=1 Tax=Solimonas marina TaxID=2714601 RepID=A0A969WCB5_9GAMM|nr:isochorismatase family cysteine hydrolase [Solimonas marina]NKF23584.1 cysteine hydrolase [Solimonas marina]